MIGSGWLDDLLARHADLDLRDPAARAKLIAAIDDEFPAVALVKPVAETVAAQLEMRNVRCSPDCTIARDVAANVLVVVRGEVLAP